MVEKQLPAELGMSTFWRLLKEQGVKVDYYDSRMNTITVLPHSEKTVDRIIYECISGQHLNPITKPAANLRKFLPVV